MTQPPDPTPDPMPLDVLVVGAGPTGLALATELAAFGVRFRIIDRHADRVRESRALAVQPRTLEVLARHGLADRLVEAGNPAVRLHLHGGGGGVNAAYGSASGANTTDTLAAHRGTRASVVILGE